MTIAAWVSLAIYAIIAAAILIPNRNVSGDRGVGLLIPMLMVPVILFFAVVLGFCQYQGWNSAVGFIAVLLTVSLFILGPVFGISVLDSYSSERTEILRGQFKDPTMTEMGLAIRSSDQPKLKALVAAHPKVDWAARDRVGFTLMGIAIWEARAALPDPPLCLRVLVEAGAPFQDDATGQNNRILHDLVTMFAENPSEIEILALVLRAGANPNEKDNRHVPALIGEYMEAKKATLLLDAGAELKSLRVNDGGERQGWDALMFAAWRARWDLSTLYLERGSDPNYRAPDGKSALSIANEYEEHQNSAKGSALARDAFVLALTKAKAAGQPKR